MIRTIFWLIDIALYLLGVCPKGLYYRSQQKKGNAEKVHDRMTETVCRWARHVLKTAGAKVTVIGQENLPEGPAVYIANHQSYFDIPVLLGYVGTPHALMAKIELSKVPGVCLWMKNLNCIFLDRQDVKASVRALMDGVKMVKDGQSLTIFPEGTRSRGGAPHEFKGGAFKIATRTKVPIVPVTIDGSFHLFEERMRIHPATVQVTIHPPIETTGMTREEQNTLPKRVEDIVLGAIK